MKNYQKSEAFTIVVFVFYQNLKGYYNFLLCIGRGDFFALLSKNAPS